MTLKIKYLYTIVKFPKDCHNAIISKTSLKQLLQNRIILVSQNCLQIKIIPEGIFSFVRYIIFLVFNFEVFNVLIFFVK